MPKAFRLGYFRRCLICGVEAEVLGLTLGSEGRSFARVCHACALKAIEEYYGITYHEAGKRIRLYSQQWIRRKESGKG